MAVITHSIQPKPQRVIISTLLIGCGLLSGVIPLFRFFMGYLNQHTTVDRLMLIGYHECPSITLAVALIFFGIATAKRLSRTWFIGIASFLLIGLPTIFISATNLLIVLFSAGLLVLTVLEIPRSKGVHYSYPLIALVLSAIFTPNIQWASVRKEVTLAQSELRTIAIAIEIYRTDHGTCPPEEAGLKALTTPIPYMSMVPQDPFRLIKENRTYLYHRWDANSYILISAGPDCVIDLKPDELPTVRPANGVRPNLLVNHLYDPTNGTISAGDVVRISGRSGL